MNSHKDWKSRVERDLGQPRCQKGLHGKPSQARPFDQHLGNKYLFKTEVTWVGESIWDAVRPIKVSVLDSAFEQ